MPENNKKESMLDGEISASESSDDYIRNVLTEIRSEYHGTSSEVIDASLQDVLKPQPFVGSGSVSVVNESTSDSAISTSVNYEEFGVSDGYHVYETRNELHVARGMGDDHARREIRKKAA